MAESLDLSYGTECRGRCIGMDGIALVDAQEEKCGEGGDDGG